MSLWLAIVCVALVSFTFKALGPAVLGDRDLPAAARNVIALLAAALLTGLIVVDVAGPDWVNLDWALLLGLGVIAGARLCRAPMLLAVLLGAIAVALLRLAFG